MSNRFEETIVDQKFIDEMNKHRQKPEGKSLLLACSESPVLFAEYMLGFKLYAWQIKFLIELNKAVSNSSPQRQFVVVTSRQIGKSTVIAIFSLWVCVFNKYPGTIHNNSLVGVVSASDDQSKKLLNEIRKLIRAGNLFMKKTYGEMFQKTGSIKGFFDRLVDEQESNNMGIITFKPWSENYGEYLLNGSLSGSVIKSRPPTTIVLGETFSVCIEDEAGRTDRITDMFHDEYFAPTGNSTNAIRIYTSTPWVPSGFFYRLCDPHNEWKGSPALRLCFTIDAIKIENPKYYATVMNTISQMNADGKTSEVQRAYYCKFVKGEKSYFDSTNVFKTFSDYTKVEKYEGLCDMGIDYGGKTTSRSVITISRLGDDGHVYRIYHRTYNVGEDEDLLEDVTDLKTKFNIQRIIPDDCPQGDYMNRRMKELGWDVQPMNFRTDKTKKFGAFRSYVNKGKIHSYPDQELQTEMMALEFAEGSRQALIQHAPGYTDDLIDSFVLSAYFMVEDEDQFNFYKWSDDDESDD